MEYLRSVNQFNLSNRITYSYYFIFYQAQSVHHSLAIRILSAKGRTTKNGKNILLLIVILKYIFYIFPIADNHNMKKSESQNIEEEESHRYSTVSSAVNSEYLYAAPTMGEFMSF